jgi:hypothetical protein
MAAIEALASTASTALVTAAVTDFFEGVRHRVAVLFGRFRPRRRLTIPWPLAGMSGSPPRAGASRPE